MQLRAADRRSVIEDLLDIQIFTVMNTLLKERVGDNKELINSMKYQIELLESKIESAHSHNDSIRQIKETEVSRLKDKLKEQITLIENEQESVQTLMADVTTLTESVSDKSKMKKNYAELEKIDGQLSTKLSKLRKDIQFYTNHENCPTCKQGIEHDFRETTIGESNSKIQEIQEAKVELSNRLDRVDNRLIEIDGVEESIAAKNLNMSEHNASHRMAMNICKQIKNDLESAEKEVEEIDSSEINKLQSTLTSKHKEQTLAFEDKETFGAIATMLKDGGIKTRIVKQYVPIMNKLINKYLAAMDFFVQFELDESFNETIKSRFRDVFSYASFSEGEKLRIDLALLFTWRSVSKLRNSVSTNLLIMDEIMDSSLDNAGTEEFLKIINELTADSNVFIISHKGDQLTDKFDNTLRFDKVKNFSRLSVA